MAHKKEMGNTCSRPAVAMVGEKQETAKNERTVDDIGSNGGLIDGLVRTVTFRTI